MALKIHDGVLLVAHGTVRDLDELPEFLLRIRHGRPASEALVAELRRRYQAIGGSPLSEITKRQTTALAKRLDRPVLFGMRLWQPSVEEVLRAATALCIERLCVLPLAPYSVHVYMDAALRSHQNVCSELGSAVPELVACAPWGTEPGFVRYWANAIRTALGGEPAEIVLTAHSLPSRAIAAGDPYEVEFRESARAIEQALDQSCRVAYQSQGADGGDWLGPDLRATLQQVAAGDGPRRVVVAPVGFVSEHVETLYDLDIEARRWAAELGLEWVRVQAPNDDPALVDALAGLATRALV